MSTRSAHRDAFASFDAPHRVDPAQIEEFGERGCVVLREVFDEADVESARVEIEAAVERRYETLHTTGVPDKSYTQMFNVWVDSPPARRLTLSPALGMIACDLLDVDGVRLIHDQALFKEPGDGRSIWHADQHYWPIDTDRACTFWIPLQDTALEMGPVGFAAGSQHVAARGQPTEEPLDPERSDGELREAIESAGLDVVTDSYRIGDVSVHAGWTLHSAGRNETTDMRRALVIHVMEEGARLIEPLNPEQRGHVELFFWEGVEPGARLDVPMCPLIYSRR